MEISSSINQEVVVDKLFRELHSWYGKKFLYMFSNGLPSKQDRDKDDGVINAKRVWARELAKYPLPIIIDALEYAKKRSLEEPPNLPKFLSFCDQARIPDKQQKLTPPKQPMPPHIAKQLRDFVEKGKRGFGLKNSENSGLRRANVLEKKWNI